MHFLWALCTFALRHRVRHFRPFRFRTHPSSPLNLKQFRAVVKPRHPSRASSPSGKKIQPLQRVNLVAVRLRSGSSSLVWAEWALQFPSFGCVLHQLLCLCKTCNVFTHHDSTEMSEDREFGFFQEAPRHARRGGSQEVGGAGKLSSF